MKKLFSCLRSWAFCLRRHCPEKACCAAKAGSEKTSCTSASSTDAEKAAAGDASIVKQVSNEGEVSYTRKEVCPTTGKVSFTSVEYCTKSGKFINVSPSEKAACCTKGAGATKVSSSEKKACAAGGKSGCCAKKGEKASTTSTSTSEDAKVKLISNGGTN